jgi:plastocyanin
MRTLRIAGFAGSVTAALCASTAFGGTVTVDVTSSGGMSPENTIVVFDPLDTVTPPAHVAATIDQINREFVPKVNVMRTGTSVTFTNSDRIRHQVYSFSPSKQFTLKLYAGSPETPVTFDKPGLVVLGCNIHDSMLAFVAIVDSPYFAKTPASGSTSFNLPAGRYRLRVWHPSLREDIPTQEIVVSASPLDIPVTLLLNANSPGGAPWPE